MVFAKRARDTHASEKNRRPMPCRYYRHYLIRKLIGRLELDGDSRFLDVGCGSGNVLGMLGELGLAGTGMDMSAEAIEIARRVVADTEIEAIVADFTTLEHEQRYDLVLSVEVIEHIEDDVGALRWMRDHLTDAGHLILTVPGCSKLYGEEDRANGHFRRYDRDDLRGRLVEAGLHPEVLWTFGPRINSRAFRLFARVWRKRGGDQSHGTTRSGYAYRPGEGKAVSALWPLYAWTLPLTLLQTPFLGSRLFDANCIALCTKAKA